MRVISIENDRFILDLKAIENILQDVDLNTKLKIVSIAGPFRTGKSFLLN